MRYAKLPLALTDQIAHLRGKGLIIDDEGSASIVLRHLGLYRFKGFARVYQNTSCPNKPFHEGTRFEDIVRVIQLDEMLRMQILSGVQIVEIGVRQRINQHMTETCGVHWYCDTTSFPFIRGRRPFDHANLLRKVEDEFHHSKGDFVEHFRRTYTDKHPPSWMMAEVMPIGAWSKMYSSLDIAAQRAIARDLGLHEATLREWLRSLTVARNVAAHHGRIWNRSFATMPIADRRPEAVYNALRTHSFATDDHGGQRLAPRLYALHILTSRITPGCHWTNDFKRTMVLYLANELPRLGFRAGWETQPEWT